MSNCIYFSFFSNWVFNTLIQLNVKNAEKKMQSRQAMYICVSWATKKDNSMIAMSTKIEKKVPEECIFKLNSLSLSQHINKQWFEDEDETKIKNKYLEQKYTNKVYTEWWWNIYIYLSGQGIKMGERVQARTPNKVWILFEVWMERI